MTRETTSLPALANARAEWGNFLGFVKRPLLPERAMLPGPEGLRAILRMLALDLALMLVLLSVAILALAVGVDIPKTALAGVEIDLQLALAVVVLAPIGEEIMFRWWLSGRPGHLVALLALVIASTAAAVLAESTTGQQAASSVVLTFGAGIVFAGIALFALRHFDAIGWFRAIFPLLFWLSTLAFASIHLLNFDEGNLAVLLPLVLPQFVLGTILGYLRVHYGLWSSITLHALHNGLILGLVALATVSAT